MSGQLDGGQQSHLINAAINRIRELGGPCIALAQTLDALRRANAIHAFNDGEYDGGAAAPLFGEPHTYLIISRTFLTRFTDRAHQSGNIDSRGVARPQTLQLVLAHEADHLGGEGHIDVDGYLTPNTMRCSDLR